MAKRISTTDFAELLLEITSNTHGSKEKIREFAKLVRREGQTRNLNQIIDRYKMLYDRKHNRLEAHVVSHTHVGEELKAKLRSELKKKYVVEEVDIEDTVDENLLGGIKLKVGDTVYDYTARGALIQLERELTK